MEDKDFLLSAEALALKHSDDELSKSFLEVYQKEERDNAECIKVASKLILKLADVKTN